MAPAASFHEACSTPEFDVVESVVAQNQARREVEFGSAIDQARFSEWLHERFATYPCSSLYAELTSLAEDALARWRLALPQKVWLRFFKDNERVIKEINECCPIVARLQLYLRERCTDVGPVSIVDLCSGFGFLSMFLSEVLHTSEVSAIHLVDQRWPLRGQQRSSEEAQSVEHIEAKCWKIPLYTRKVDIKKGREQRQLAEHIFECAPKGGVVLLAVHLCGTLSCKAVELYNANPQIRFMALKPCCLPGHKFVRDQISWTLGNHSFSASDLYCFPNTVSEASLVDKTLESKNAQSSEVPEEIADGRRKHAQQTLDGVERATVEPLIRASDELAIESSPIEQVNDSTGASELVLPPPPQYANRQERDAGRKRSAEALRRRAEQRRLRAKERVSGSRPLRQQSEGEKRAADARSQKGERLLRNWAGHLLKGLTDSEHGSCVDADCSRVATLEEHVIQPHHFQNLFVFAHRRNES